MRAKRRFSLISIILVAVVLMACMLFTGSADEALISETEVMPLTEEVMPTDTPDTQATADAKSTTDAQRTIEAQETADAQASATAVAAETQKALDRQATSTQAMAVKQTATAEVIRQSTAQAEVMAERIQMLVDDGIVPNTQGAHHRLADFDESWAQLNWFKWWPTAYDPENFAIRTDAAWSSASETANWFSSGCGFIFGLQDNDNFHVSHLRLDGYVTLLYWQNGNGKWVAQRSAGKVSTPDGEAEILLVVYDKRVTVYVNGEKKLSDYAGLLKPGKLALTLTSGTNKDYGTRCQMSDIDLWIFE